MCYSPRMSLMNCILIIMHIWNAARNVEDDNVGLQKWNNQMYWKKYWIQLTSWHCEHNNLGLEGKEKKKMRMVMVNCKVFDGWSRLILVFDF